MNYQLSVGVMVSYLHLTSSHVWEKRCRDGSWEKVKVTQLCLTLCDLMDYSPPVPSAHGILQARILEWVAIPFSRGSSQPRYWTQVFCITGRFFTSWATREAQSKEKSSVKSRMEEENEREQSELCMCVNSPFITQAKVQERRFWICFLFFSGFQSSCNIYILLWQWFNCLNI